MEKQREFNKKLSESMMERLKRTLEKEREFIKRFHENDNIQKNIQQELKQIKEKQWELKEKERELQKQVREQQWEEGIMSIQQQWKQEQLKEQERLKQIQQKIKERKWENLEEERQWDQEDERLKERLKQIKQEQWELKEREQELMEQFNEFIQQGLKGALQREQALRRELALNQELDLDQHLDLDLDLDEELEMRLENDFKEQVQNFSILLNGIDARSENLMCTRMTQICLTTIEKKHLSTCFINHADFEHQNKRFRFSVIDEALEYFDLDLGLEFLEFLEFNAQEDQMELLEEEWWYTKKEIKQKIKKGLNPIPIIIEKILS
jgi:hypothetical protein